LRRFIAPTTLVLMLAGWATLLPAAAPPAQDPRAKLHPFVVRTLDGRTLRSSELRGRPLVLEFWATWSPPSRASMPVLCALQARYGGRGLIVIGLSLDDESPQRVLDFARRQRLLFPVAMASETMLDDYGPIRSLPTAILIDRKGRIVRRIVGHLDAETLEGFIREIL
jgi:thiol-disulfide isomerase/thioredoxin